MASQVKHGGGSMWSMSSLRGGESAFKIELTSNRLNSCYPMFISNDFIYLFIYSDLDLEILTNYYVLLQNVTESRTCQNVGKVMQTELVSLTWRNSIYIVYG